MGFSYLSSPHCGAQGTLLPCSLETPQSLQAPQGRGCLPGSPTTNPKKPVVTQAGKGMQSWQRH